MILQVWGGRRPRPPPRCLQDHHMHSARQSCDRSRRFPNRCNTECGQRGRDEVADREFGTSLSIVISRSSYPREGFLCVLDIFSANSAVKVLRKAVNRRERRGKSPRTQRNAFAGSQRVAAAGWRLRTSRTAQSSTRCATSHFVVSGTLIV